MDGQGLQKSQLCISDSFPQEIAKQGWAAQGQPFRGLTDRSARFYVEGPQVRAAGVLVFVPRGVQHKEAPCILGGQE